MKKIYSCSDCGTKTLKWSGQCYSCESWNTLTEGVEETKNHVAISPKLLSDIGSSMSDRIRSYSSEFDRALGEGLVRGSVVLLTGSPGIGKSTLLLQIMLSYAKKNKVLYAAGEESEEQIKSRAMRIKAKSNLELVASNNIDGILNYATSKSIDVVAIDSIQTLVSSELNIPGSISQIRECLTKIIQVAKSRNISFLIIGHVNKDGQVAGPKLLEHMVDTVLEFEGENELEYRILRASKNRFGAVNEIGIFNMSALGMEDVLNPSEYFIEKGANNAGSVIVPIIEGNRVFLVEVQTLVSNSLFGMPRRISQGADLNKAQIVCAIVEKMLKFNLLSKDVFFNIPGGVKTKDPGLSLGLALALISALKNEPLPEKSAAIGEIGLTGEVRKVSFMQKRVQELQRLGFKRVYLPHCNVESTMELVFIDNLKLLKF